jgi:hypothetical protein
MVNVQHDCRSSECQASSSRRERQEQEITMCVIPQIAHQEDNHYILNMAALHNAHLICQALPRNLTAPHPLQTDRRAFHHQLAESLRISQQAKRQKTAAKLKATREANKKRKRAAERGGHAGQELNGGNVKHGDSSSPESEDSMGSDVGNPVESDEDIADEHSDDDADLPEVRTRRARPLKRQIYACDGP